MAGGSAFGVGTACPRAEPEVFKTNCGKIIVVDELFHFISLKMRTLCHDKVVLLATNNFSSDWIEKSKGFLFEVCPTTMQRKIKHTGCDKDAKNVKACLSLFNESGENMPMFVSHFLDKLPPVGFGNMDTSALLSRVEQLSSEVSGLRWAIEAQVTVNEDLSAATAAVKDGRRPTPVLDLRAAAGASRDGEALKQTSPGRQEVTALDPPDAAATESTQL
ncbi:hypothetical protein ABVT39_018636 [Epinephelus coioides]